MLSGGTSWTVYSAPTMTPATESLISAASSGGSGAADAFINFSSVNDPEASELTTGTSQPWYNSPAVTQAFGHTLSPSEQSAFASEVLSDVETTYSLAGLSPKVTIDPTVAADHTISVVSGLSYGANASAIGITDVGHNGFGFIDKLDYATTPDQLAWAVAHNVAHELMHAFGIGIHPDQTGQYIDAATATWGLLTDPNATFSPAAASLIISTNYGSTPLPGGPSGTGSAETLRGQVDGDQEILAVPEPTTVAGWSLVVAGLFYRRSRSTRRNAA